MGWSGNAGTERIPAGQTEISARRNTEGDRVKPLFLGEVDRIYRRSLNVPGILPNATVLKFHRGNGDYGQAVFLLPGFSQLLQTLDVPEVDDDTLMLARLHINDHPAVIGDFLTGGGFESHFEADGPHRSPVIGVEHDRIETVGLRLLNRSDDHRGLKVDTGGKSDLLAAKKRAAQQPKKSGCYNAHGLNLSHLAWVI